MGIFEIISAIVLIIACVFIVIVVLMQDTKTQMSQTISGNSSDNYYGKNSGRTKEAMLNKAMTTAAIVFFVLALVVNIVNVYLGGSRNDSSASSDTSSISTSVDSTASDAGAAGTAEESKPATAEASSNSNTAATAQAESGQAAEQ